MLNFHRPGLTAMHRTTPHTSSVSDLLKNRLVKQKLKVTVMYNRRPLAVTYIVNVHLTKEKV